MQNLSQEPNPQIVSHRPYRITVPHFLIPQLCFPLPWSHVIEGVLGGILVLPKGATGWKG
jgi:hypothetical protein